MHIKISKSSLSEALNNVATIVSSKTSLPVLQNVKIEAEGERATFVCSDLDTTLFATTDCEVVEGGATTIPVKTFAAAVSKVVDGIIEIKVDDKDVAKLQAGSTRFSFRGLPAKDFPVFPKTEGAPVKIDCKVVREMFRQTAFAMSQDDTRRTLLSVLLDFSSGDGNVKAVATDGRRLSLAHDTVGVPPDFKNSFVVPRKAVETLLKKLPREGECNLIAQGSLLKFETPRLVLLTKLLEDAYPAYGKVIPSITADNKIVIDRAAFLGAIDRISVFTSGTESPTMVLTFGNNRLVLASGDTEFGSSVDEIAIKYSGETIEMRFNPQYISEALNVLGDEDEIEFYLINDTSPVVIRKVNSDDYTYVVMPLRTK